MAARILAIKYARMNNKYMYAHEYKCNLGNNCMHYVLEGKRLHEVKPSVIYSFNTQRKQLFPMIVRLRIHVINNYSGVSHEAIAKAGIVTLYIAERP